MVVADHPVLRPRRIVAHCEAVEPSPRDREFARNGFAGHGMAMGASMVRVANSIPAAPNQYPCGYPGKPQGLANS